MSRLRADRRCWNHKSLSNPPTTSDKDRVKTRTFEKRAPTRTALQIPAEAIESMNSEQPGSQRGLHRLLKCSPVALRACDIQINKPGPSTTPVPRALLQ